MRLSSIFDIFKSRVGNSVGMEIIVVVSARKLSVARDLVLRIEESGEWRDWVMCIGKSNIRNEDLVDPIPLYPWVSSVGYSFRWASSCFILPFSRSCMILV